VGVFVNRELALKEVGFYYIAGTKFELSGFSLCSNKGIARPRSPKMSERSDPKVIGIRYVRYRERRVPIVSQDSGLWTAFVDCPECESEIIFYAVNEILRQRIRTSIQKRPGNPDFFRFSRTGITEIVAL
jgi:hypothetical protein